MRDGKQITPSSEKINKNKACIFLLGNVKFEQKICKCLNGHEELKNGSYVVSMGLIYKQF